MHAIANMMNDVPTNNYKNVICMGLLLDANGQKMSKSKGNVVAPWEVFNKYGADVVRFWFYSVNQPGEAKNFDEKSLDEVNKKVFNILRNVVSFYEMYKPEAFPWVNPFDSTNVLDQWMLAKLQNLSQVLVANLDTYKVMESARAIRDFVTELSTWYVRRSRDRFKSSDEADKNFALVTLQFVLDNLARYMAPFTPFIAEEMYQKVRVHKFQESVHLETWHTWNDESRFSGTLEPMDQVRELVTLGLDARQKANSKVRQPLNSISIAPVNIPEEYLEILKEELNVKKVIMLDTLDAHTVILDTEITPELQAEGDMREMVRTIQEMRKEADLVPTDKVIVSLKASQPEWFNELKTELQGLVGAQDVVWQAESDSVKKI
jgi:isoleucyl-tRNA synthetase